MVEKKPLTVILSHQGWESRLLKTEKRLNSRTCGSRMTVGDLPSLSSRAERGNLTNNGKIATMLTHLAMTVGDKLKHLTMTSGVMKRTIRLIGLAFLFTMFFHVAHAETFKAEIGKTAFQDGENISLSLKFSGGSIDGEPDLSPLEKDFDILGKSTSSNVTFYNGHLERSYKWILTLIPKKSGNLVIPSVSLGNLKTNPINITVGKGGIPKAGEPAPEMFAKAVIDNANPYVQEQIILTVRLYGGLDIANLALTSPELEGADIRQLDNQENKIEEINGRNYRVIERRFALFPQTSGKFTISPILFEGSVRVKRARRRGRFPHMFDNMFDQFSMRQIRTRSNSIDIKVKPRPAQSSGAWWLPARNLELFDAWKPNPPEFRTGEAVTRIIGIQAARLTAEQLPDVSFAETDAFKLYPGDSNEENLNSNEGVAGLKQQTFVIIPNQAGTITFPAIEIPWWDTKTNKSRIAKLPSKTVQVTPAKGSKPKTIAPKKPAPIIQKKIIEQEKPLKQQPNIWKIVSGVLTVILLAIIGFFVIKKNKSVKVAKTLPSINLSSSAKAIKKACELNQPKDAKTALMEWGKTKWADNPPTNANAIAKLLENDELAKAVEELNHCLYAGDKTTWNGDEFWKVFLSARQNKETKQSKSSDVLPKLYSKRP